LSPAIICSNKGRKNTIRIIGTVWEFKKNNRQFFENWKEIIGGFSSTLGAGLDGKPDYFATGGICPYC